MKNRADSPIRLTTDWKRYSFTFTADGVSRYSPYYGIEKQPAWFDRFMLNAGDRPLDWAPTTDYIAHIGLPEADGNVYEIGKPVDIDISLTKFTEKKTEGPLHVKVIDYQGTVVMERKLEPEFDSGREIRIFLPFSRRPERLVHGIGFHEGSAGCIIIHLSLRVLRSLRSKKRNLSSDFAAGRIISKR